MSRRRKKDYKKVLKKLKTLLPTEPSVQAIVMDFEAAVWQAIRKVFPVVTVKGCAFHWTQSVWKKVKEVGLQASYNAGGDIQKLVRRLLTLPLLPAEHIPVVFLTLKQKAVENDLLTMVFCYVENYWMDSTMWSPEDWSVYGQPIRMNNDCEGWHRRLNTRAKCAPPFYELVKILHQEVEYVTTQVKLVSCGKLSKKQKKSTRQNEVKIFKVWESYSHGGMSAESLLRKLACAYSQ